jgi:3-oxoacyl-(acyl-carrier-protein) synthase
MELKRVVVTGLGALTPIGNNISEYWDGLKNGRGGCAPITYFDTEKFKTKFACEIKNFDPLQHFDRKEARKLDRFAQYAMVSSAEAIEDAGIDASEVDAINTHGTSTPLGDVAELKAISAIFGKHANNININSTKSMTGHLLGAAGAIEAIASILAMQNSLVPPTINHTTVDENIDPSLNLTLNKAQEREVNIAMSNTFGFGGHNACVLFRKLEA